MLSTRPQNTQGCSLKDCTISDPALCLSRNVVYQVRCSGCDAIYIGSTIRQLHTRIKEHLTSEQSSIKRHLSACTATAQIAIKILARDHDAKNLRLKEALLIMDCKPTINTKEEEKELLTLVQPAKWA